MRRMIRDLIIRLIREDLIIFLTENEEALVKIFREEMQAIDNRVPDEKTFVDLRMSAMGEELLRGVLKALKRFIAEQ